AASCALDGRRRHHHRRADRRHRVPDRDLQKGATVIRLENVVKHYGSEVTIGPLSLELPSGGIIALVGPNGAGKSTVLTMMGRLQAPDEGRVEIDGLDVQRAP